MADLPGKAPFSDVSDYRGALPRVRRRGTRTAARRAGRPSPTLQGLRHGLRAGRSAVRPSPADRGQASGLAGSWGEPDTDIASVTRTSLAGGTSCRSSGRSSRRGGKGSPDIRRTYPHRQGDRQGGGGDIVSATRLAEIEREGRHGREADTAESERDHRPCRREQGRRRQRVRPLLGPVAGLCLARSDAERRPYDNGPCARSSRPSGCGHP